MPFAWEQRKLSELADFSKGSGYSKGDLREAGTPIILYGRLYTGYETVISEVDTFVTERENSVFSKGGEVIVPASGETAEDISRAAVVENAGIILGGDLNVLKAKPELDPAFLAITISNGTQQKELSKRAQGKSVVHLHNSDLQEVWLRYPKLDEQKKIRSLFGALDDLITLHQRKLRHLQEQKKALLQQMFI
jgi:type I restriction enzyme S subunit